MRDAAIRYLTWILVIAAPLTALTFLAATPGLFLLGIGAILALVVPYPLYLATTLQLVSPAQMRGRLTGLLIGVIPMFSQGLGPMLIGGLTDFAFHDPQKLPAALSIVMVGGMLASFLCLRLALRTLRPLLARDRPA
ncbi:hypothetical protein [Phenylobacterium sp. J367]|uniref:hypothetical protein n=1 Tax=Phenylobacterium sp. J367 TaxID=2898435 RepID=UPI002150A1A8|nr:hypothetical protein [Phenylobacterium sp. J367]MCR5879598.1 hypothetical protein [Phenylobacterium sp. J367]